MASWYRSGRNVAADNFFTVIPLSGDHIKNGLTHVGTIRSNKVETSAKIKPNRTREVYSFIFELKRQAAFDFYVPVKNRSVTVLSTMDHDTLVAGEDQKPEIIMY